MAEHFSSIHTSCNYSGQKRDVNQRIDALEKETKRRQFLCSMNQMGVCDQAMNAPARGFSALNVATIPGLSCRTGRSAPVCRCSWRPPASRASAAAGPAQGPARCRRLRQTWGRGGGRDKCGLPNKPQGAVAHQPRSRRHAPAPGQHSRTLSKAPASLSSAQAGSHSARCAA